MELQTKEAEGAEFLCNDLLILRQKIHELNVTLRRLAVWWNQRAKIRWFEECDTNSKFLQNFASSRRNAKWIRQVKDVNNNLVVEEDHIEQAFLHFFEKKREFRNCDLTGWPDPADNLKLDAFGAVVLNADFSLEECKTAIFQQGNNKSSGLDWVTSSFFKCYWNLVGETTWNALKKFLKCGVMHKEWKDTIIILIPKILNLVMPSNYRPISLCQRTYKIVATILVNRRKKCLPRMISEEQVAFIRGRSISEHCLLAQEIFNKFNVFKNKQGLMAVKLDMEQAYDSMGWPTLNQILHWYGFPVVFTKLIMECGVNARFSISMNGRFSKWIDAHCGFRQACPLSPYLFILCSQLLNIIIEQKGKSLGIQVSPRGPRISHLLYTDDVLLLSKDSAPLAQLMNCNVKSFCNWTGERVNVNKSQVIFGKNVKISCRKKVACIFGFKVFKKLHYLGVKISLNKLGVADFQDLLCNITDRLNVWGRKSLSLGDWIKINVDAALLSLKEVVLEVFSEITEGDFFLHLEGKSSIGIIANKTSWIIATIYGSTDSGERKIPWNNLEKFKSSKSPMVMGGDFNCILSQDDKKGGKKFFLTQGAQDMLSFLRECNFHDTRFIGPKFEDIWLSYPASHSVVWYAWNKPSVGNANFILNTVVKKLGSNKAPGMSNLFPKIISEVQYAFVKGRLMSDQILLAQELFHKFRFSKSKKGFVSIKVDMEIGGNIGMRISPNAPLISHLMYADDIIIFSEAKKKSLKTISAILKNYCRWTGQQYFVLDLKAWLPPPPGWIKCNVDASLSSNNLAGIGGVFRDDKGRFYGAFGFNINHWDIAQAEIHSILSLRKYVQEWMLDTKGFMIKGDNHNYCLMKEILELHMKEVEMGYLSEVESWEIKVEAKGVGFSAYFWKKQKELESLPNLGWWKEDLKELVELICQIQVIPKEIARWFSCPRGCNAIEDIEHVTTKFVKLMEARNKFIHEKVKERSMVILAQVVSYGSVSSSICGLNLGHWGVYQSSRLLLNHWHPPPPDWIKVNVDASLLPSYKIGQDDREIGRDDREIGREDREIGRTIVRSAGTIMMTLFSSIPLNVVIPNGKSRYFKDVLADSSSSSIKLQFVQTSFKGCLALKFDNSVVMQLVAPFALTLVGKLHPHLPREKYSSKQSTRKDVPSVDHNIVILIPDAIEGNVPKVQKNVEEAIQPIIPHNELHSTNGVDPLIVNDQVDGHSSLIEVNVVNELSNKIYEEEGAIFEEGELSRDQRQAVVAWMCGWWVSPGAIWSVPLPYAWALLEGVSWCLSIAPIIGHGCLARYCGYGEFLLVLVSLGLCLGGLYLGLPVGFSPLLLLFFHLF
ncbi:hypothetical protein KFK09_004936 [Dendrobium nobile]|uniref:Reverse transcriptase domain-containing protein n=1 Tax=Dendrobium nobile TaxID=94219 RepID=A0A8T3BZV9_DENNO|nr:hypothetical protein KFK09_004936 [Dendrobium nobile]